MRGQAVGDGRVDGHLGEVAQHALVVVRPAAATLGLHRSGALEGAPHGLGDPAHALRVGGEDRDHTQVVQGALGGHGPGPHAGAHDGGVAGPAARLEQVDGRDHRQVLGLGADAVRHRRVCGRGDQPLPPCQAEQVGGVAAPDALDVVQVGRPAVQHPRGVGGPKGLVQAVGVDRELDVVAVGDVERAAQLLRPGGHVLVDLEPGPAGGERLLDALRARRRSPHQERDVQRRLLERRPGDAQPGRRVGAQVPDWPVVLGDDRRDAACERGLAQLGREPVHVAVDPARRDHHAPGVEERRLRVEHDVDAVHRVRVAGPADRTHTATPNAN